jgi:hypothetical protein
MKFQLGLFGGKPKPKRRNGRRKGQAPKVGMGSCVWALVDPSSTRTPGTPGFGAGKKWRRAKVHAYGKPFKRLWVRLNRTIGGQDLEAAERISWHKTRPRSTTAGVTPAEFVKRAGPMGRYQLETCER